MNIILKKELPKISAGTSEDEKFPVAITGFGGNSDHWAAGIEITMPITPDVTVKPNFVVDNNNEVSKVGVQVVYNIPPDLL